MNFSIVDLGAVATVIKSRDGTIAAAVMLKLKKQTAYLGSEHEVFARPVDPSACPLKSNPRAKGAAQRP